MRRRANLHKVGQQHPRTPNDGRKRMIRSRETSGNAWKFKRFLDGALLNCVVPEANCAHSKILRNTHRILRIFTTRSIIRYHSFSFNPNSSDKTTNKQSTPKLASLVRLMSCTHSNSPKRTQSCCHHKQTRIIIVAERLVIGE